MRCRGAGPPLLVGYLPAGCWGVLMYSRRFEEAPRMEAYAGQQFVGIDLHRRRSVIVHTTDRRDPLETVRISNDVDSLTKVMARAGVGPEVVLEATYGWYWAADVLRCGARRRIWRIRWGLRRSRTGGSRTTSGMRPTWRTCCGWAGCRRRGSPRRRPGSCGSWSGTAPSWSRSAPAVSARSMRCWRSAASRC